MTPFLASYLRISKEDKYNEHESDSIQNQRELINAFIREHNDLNSLPFTEIIDDGFSGAHFERPGIKRLLHMIKKREVSVLIFKDFSRFGRNYIEIGYLTEKLLPSMGVRLISINDNYDSQNSHFYSLDLSLKNFIYSLYSKDLSSKIKSVKRQKINNGEFVGGYAPFGYIKDSNVKSRLLPDPITAPIVKRIFALAENGYGNKNIAEVLNKENIMTPALYKKSAGAKRVWYSSDISPHWTAQSIFRILTDERYTGVMIGGKRTRRDVGKNNSTVIAKDKHIKIANTHAGIIDKALFDKVNKRKRDVKNSNHKDLSPLKGKMLCGYCKKKLFRVSTKNSYYKCLTPYYLQEAPCCDKIDEDLILSLLEHIIFLFLQVLNIEENLNVVAHKEATRSKNCRALQEVGLLERKKNILEQYSCGLLSKKEFTQAYSSLNPPSPSAPEFFTNNTSISAPLVLPVNQIFNENRTSIASQLIPHLIKNITVGERNELVIAWSFSSSVFMASNLN